MPEKKDVTVRSATKEKSAEYHPDIRLFFPAADVYEAEDEYLIYLDMPGVKKNDLKVKIENDSHLLVEGRIDRQNRLDGHYIINECLHTGYHRHFNLPDDADRDKVKADFKEGVLEIHLPKREKAKPREISIN